MKQRLIRYQLSKISALKSVLSPVRNEKAKAELSAKKYAQYCEGAKAGLSAKKCAQYCEGEVPER